MLIRAGLSLSTLSVSHYLCLFHPTVVWSKAKASTRSEARYLKGRFPGFRSQATASAATLNATNEVPKTRQHDPQAFKNSRIRSSTKQRGSHFFLMKPPVAENFISQSPANSDARDSLIQSLPRISPSERQTEFSALRQPHKRQSSTPANPLFENVSPLDIDTRAGCDVEDFLRSDSNNQQSQQAKRALMGAPKNTSDKVTTNGRVMLVNVGEKNLKQCALSFYIDGRRVSAVGQSTRAKTAKMLCFMHAKRLIEYYSGKIDVSLPPPLPLKEDTHTDDAKSTHQGPFSSQRFPEHDDFSSPRPPAQSDNPEAWSKYISDCEAYIQKKKTLTYKKAVLSRHIPPSTNDIVNGATQMLESGRTNDSEVKKSNTHLALHRLNTELHNAAELIQAVRIGNKLFNATLVLEEATSLIATGVGYSAKEAKRSCASHALCILKLLQEQRQIKPSSTQMLPRCKGKNLAFPDPCDQNAVSTAQISSILSGLNAHYDRLYRLYRFLFKDALDPVVSFKQQNRDFVCELSFAGLTCEGRGINRFEAQRSAMQAAFSKLEMQDDRVKAIADFALKYPNVSASKIPRAVLPGPLSERVRDAIRKINEELGRKGGPRDSCTVEKLKEDNKALSEVEGFMFAHWKKDRVRSDPAYSASLRRALSSLHANPIYLRKFHQLRSTLSIAAMERQILDYVAVNRVTIICGTTGCGKTTQVPQYLFDEEIRMGRGAQCNIIVTQPRRITAFSVADRIAEERLSVIGEDVGYAVRLEAKMGRHINLCTSGVLLQIISLQPNLEHISHLIVDEVHERDINCDVILALVKQILTKNPSIKIILMSATMHAPRFATYFGGAPVVQVEGCMYPVQVRYLEEIATIASCPGVGLRSYSSPMFSKVRQQKLPTPRGTSGAKRGTSRDRQTQDNLLVPPKMDYQLIAYLVHYSIHVHLQGNPRGKSILVFLPGWKELMAAKQAIERMEGILVDQRCDSKLRYKIILLHSTISSDKQRECFQPAPEGFVKIVLATNIAESGITIDDAAVVIDTGLVKQTSWTLRTPSDAVENFSTLNSSIPIESQQSLSFSTQLGLSYASRANATQRKGRAGRTQSGVCYRIFTRTTWESLPEFQEPEIRRVPLTQLLLKLLALGYTEPKSTLATFMEPPSSTNVEASMDLLKNLEAVTVDEKLTSLGYYLSKLPCDPRIGKMVMMGAVLQCLDSVLTVAACADMCPFVTSREVAMEARKHRCIFSRGSQSDHISFLNAYNGFCVTGEDMEFARLNYLHVGNIRTISKYKKQYCDILYRSGLINRDDLVPIRLMRKEIKSNDTPCVARDDSYSAIPEGYDDGLFVDNGALSRWSLNVALVKACLCAAFFPNVALLDPPSMLEPDEGSKDKASRKVWLRAKTHTAIRTTTESVCYRFGAPREHNEPTREELMQEIVATAKPPSMDNPTTPAMFYVYQEIFAVRETNKTFLTNVSSISMWSLLLFGVSDANSKYFEELGLCVVDGWIFIQIDPPTFHILLDLRHTLHECVWHRYKDSTHKANNTALDILRELIKDVLEAPLHVKDLTRLNRLVDSGVIVPPQITNSVNSTHEAMQRKLDDTALA